MGGDADALYGEEGSDVLYGDKGDDALYFSLEHSTGDHDVYNGGSGFDTLYLVLTAEEQSAYATEIAAAQDAIADHGSGTFLWLDFSHIETLAII
jgi:Ca2+-binding RTX toxin-like protein